MQNPMGLIKKAPRWAIYTSGGVILGVFALRMYKNRTTGATDEMTDTTEAEQVGTGPAYGTGGASPGVIVPPVIVSGGGGVDQSGTGLGELQAMYLSAVGSVVDQGQNLVAGLFQQNSQLIDGQGNIVDSVFGLLGQSQSQIGAIAAAGAAPQPVYQNPTPVVADVPPPAPAPIAAPAPAPPKPDPCVGTYPYLNEANGQCYTVACATGNGAKRKGKWHLYANIPDVFISPNC